MANEEEAGALNPAQLDDAAMAAELRALGVALNSRGLVPLTESERRVRRVGAAVTLVLALIFAGMGVHSALTFDDYLTEGTPVMGEVIERARDGSSLRIEFELPDGKSASFLTPAPADGQDLENGAQLPVRYFAPDGSDARLDDSRGYWAPMLLGVFVCVTLLGASFLFFWSLRGKDPELVLLTLAEDATRAKEEEEI